MTPQGVLKFFSLALFPYTCQEPQLSWSAGHLWKIDTLELLPVQLTWGISLYLYLWKAQLFLQLPVKTHSFGSLSSLILVCINGTEPLSPGCTRPQNAVCTILIIHVAHAKSIVLCGDDLMFSCVP